MRLLLGLSPLLVVVFVCLFYPTREDRAPIFWAVNVDFSITRNILISVFIIESIHWLMFVNHILVEIYLKN